jgi:N6-adenosine-specific RNA methylase IME4
MRHVNEKCYMFKRAIPIRPLEKFFHEQSVPNSIHSVMKGMKVSQKPTQMFEFVEAMVPVGPWLDLWGRWVGQRENWITVGNEAIHQLPKEERPNYKRKNRNNESEECHVEKEHCNVPLHA